MLHFTISGREPERAEPAVRSCAFQAGHPAKHAAEADVERLLERFVDA